MKWRTLLQLQVTMAIKVDANRKMNVVGPRCEDLVQRKAWNGRKIRFIGDISFQMSHEIPTSPGQSAVRVQHQQ